MKIVFATNNAHKLSEIKSILGSSIEIVSLSDIGCTVDIPETGKTLEENARIKAAYVFEHYGLSRRHGLGSRGTPWRTRRLQRTLCRRSRPRQRSQHAQTAWRIGRRAPPQRPISHRHLVVASRRESSPKAHRAPVRRHRHRPHCHRETWARGLRLRPHLYPRRL